MATTLTKLLRREVVALDTGRTLGRPADVLIDPERHRVAVIVITRGSLPETSVVVHAKDVQSFAADTIAIDRLGSLIVAAHDPQALELLRRGLEFRGRPVLSSEGKSLGRITSILVDEAGHVAQYRVRKGLLGYLRPSLKVDPADLRTSGGEVAVVVRHEQTPEPPVAGAGDERP